MADRKWLSRTELLLGEENMKLLEDTHVLVLGLGGVGSFAAEFICRGGVGKMTIVDGDVVDPSNRNRQLPALSSTHGLSKADIMYDRLKDINPDLELVKVKDFQTPEMVKELLKIKYDYVVDAIDSLTPKINFIAAAFQNGQKIVSSMGAGGKVDPTQVQITDLSKTHTCLLAYDVRKRLREFKIETGITAVFSPEKVIKSSLMHTDGSNFKKSAYGTMSYLPAAFGAACASVVLRSLTGHLE
jgi:tRNA threonylcarbamoyladenosine dehydratase